MPTQPLDGPPVPEPGTPAELRGLIDFLNSRASAKRPERFDTPEHAAAFLGRCDLGYDGRPLSGTDTARLGRLRDALMSALGDAADPSPWAAINELAATAPMYLQTAPGPAAALRAAHDNAAQGVIVAVLEKLANAIETERWSRLGACAGCRLVFYDSTRSHTRRWCSYATCGNRANVASYRQRARSN